MNRAKVITFSYKNPDKDLAKKIFDELSGNEVRYDPWADDNLFDIFERDVVAFAYGAIADDVTRAAQEFIAPHYRKLDKQATLLNNTETHLLCATVTQSLGRSASRLARERNLDTKVEISNGRETAHIDAERFLRRLQNELFDYYKERFGYQ